MAAVACRGPTIKAPAPSSQASAQLGIEGAKYHDHQAENHDPLAMSRLLAGAIRQRPQAPGLLGHTWIDALVQPLLTALERFSSRPLMVLLWRIAPRGR